jgi:hypothetical protein
VRPLICIWLWPRFHQLFPDDINRGKVQRRALGTFGFVRDLAGIAHRLGIELTIGGGGWSDDTHATPFTRFVFAVERLLPRKAKSNSLTACAKQIERAIKASAHEIDSEEAIMASVQEFGSERAFKAFVREFRKKTRREKRSSKPAHSLLDK